MAYPDEMYSYIVLWAALRLADYGLSRWNVALLKSQRVYLYDWDFTAITKFRSQAALTLFGAACLGVAFYYGSHCGCRFYRLFMEFFSGVAIILQASAVCHGIAGVFILNMNKKGYLLMGEQRLSQRFIFLNSAGKSFGLVALLLAIQCVQGSAFLWGGIFGLSAVGIGYYRRSFKMPDLAEDKAK